MRYILTHFYVGVFTNFDFIMHLFGGGYALGAYNNDSSSESAEETSTSTHAHKSVFEVSPEDAPSIDIAVFEDKKSGYNIYIMTENFSFSPENVNGDKGEFNLDGEMNFEINGREL